MKHRLQCSNGVGWPDLERRKEFLMTTLTRSLLTAAAVCVLGVSIAHAQSHDQRNDQRQGQRQDQRRVQRPHAQPPQAQRPHRPDYRPDNRPDYRPDSHPGYRPGYGPSVPPHLQGQRGAGPNHNWYRGARMPAVYRTHHYVVDDWRLHRLTPPPRGYYWVQNGADYLLVAIATGVIAQIILGY